MFCWIKTLNLSEGEFRSIVFVEIYLQQVKTLKLKPLSMFTCLPLDNEPIMNQWYNEMNGKSFEQQKINLRKAVISNVLQQEKKIKNHNSQVYIHLFNNMLDYMVNIIVNVKIYKLLGITFFFCMKCHTIKRKILVHI